PETTLPMLDLEDPTTRIKATIFVGVSLGPGSVFKDTVPLDPEEFLNFEGLGINLDERGRCKREYGLSWGLQKAVLEVPVQIVLLERDSQGLFGLGSCKT
ncbi:MAG: hypothetical protein LN412_04505, partial [Candidatus Thermoplasmatota archaeon]|nr:hypothetical protein [Candidatus Thermoplasmatota archaeon]